MTVAALIQVLQWASAVGFLAIGGLAFRDWLRLRDPGRGYLALAIGSLGIVSAIGQVVKGLPQGLVGVVNDLNLVLFVVSGLALLLFRDTVIPLGRRVKTAVLVVSAAIGVLTIAARLPSGTAPHYTSFQFVVVLAVVGLWSVSVGEPSIRMWLVAQGLPAVQRARLRALSAGYGGIVAVLVLAVGAGSNASAPAVQIVTAGAVLALIPLLYAGFAPPAWLRRIWRQKEEAKFQQATQDLVMHSPDAPTFGAKALDWALRLAGAKQGFIAFPDTTILAVTGLPEEGARRLLTDVGSAAEVRRVVMSDGTASTAIVCPLATQHAAGTMVLLAGPFTPVFGVDEVDWIRSYAVLVAAGLDRMGLIERMATLNEALAHKVQEVTQQKSALEAANRELEAYSYTISHDLRAPLRAINGFTKILMDEHASELSEDARDSLRRVSESGRHMSELVDDLLAFSRLGRQPMRKQSVDTAEIVRNAWGQLSADLDGRQVDLRVDDLPLCESDPILLEQVFVNLLSNALKYTRTRATATIEVGVLKSDPPTVFFVKDNGVGFDMQYAGRLFGVFQRLHRAEEYEGTGVGLATVHRIVERHGGRVWAEAQPDKGATFYFTLTGAEQWQAAAA